MRLLKNSLLAAIFSVFLISANAVEFRGILSNDSIFEGQKFSELILDQKDTAIGWIRIPFTDDGLTYFAAEGLYQFEVENIDLFDVSDADSNRISAWDVDLFKFSHSREINSAMLTVSAGRFATFDLSGVIYNQMADGVFASYETQSVFASFYGAYTGLTNARTVAILDPEFVEDTEKHYQKNAKYVVASAGLSMPNFFLDHTISVQLLGTFKTEGEGFNRIYNEILVNGPIKIGKFKYDVYYTLVGVLGLWKEGTDSIQLTNLSKGTLTTYLPFKSSSVSLNALYASGEQGPFKTFAGFTSMTAVNAYTGRTEHTGVILTGVSGSMKPLGNLRLSAFTDIVVDAQEDIGFEGIQYGLGAEFLPLSDVSLGLNIGQYIDGDDSDRNKCTVRVRAAISF